MLEFFSKIVEKYDQNFLFRPISMKNFLGTNQTIYIEYRTYMHVLFTKTHGGFTETCDSPKPTFISQKHMFYV